MNISIFFSLSGLLSVLMRRAMLRETLSSLSPTEEGCDPTLLVVWHPSNGAYRLLGRARFS